MPVTRRAAIGQPILQKKDDIFADLDKSHKRSCFSCRNFGCGILLVIAIGVFGILGVVAQTGIIQIPGISDMFYSKPPVPLRFVLPSGPVSVEELLKSKTKDIAQTSEMGNVQVVATEEELTQILREPRANGQVPIKQAQIVVEPAFVELYGTMSLFNDSKSSIVLRVRVKPTGQPATFALDEIWLGYVKIPNNLAKIIIKNATGYSVPDTFSAQQFNIENAILGNGSATLTVPKKALTK